MTQVDCFGRCERSSPSTQRSPARRLRNAALVTAGLLGLASRQPWDHSATCFVAAGLTRHVPLQQGRLPASAQLARRYGCSSTARMARGKDGEEQGGLQLPPIPWIVVGAVALASAPALLLGATALGWSALVALSVAGFLYFTVALPLVIVGVIVAAVLLFSLGSTLLAATSKILSLLLAAAALGLVYFAASGNIPAQFEQVPFLSGLLSSGKSRKPASKAAVKEPIIKDETIDDWDRRFSDVAEKINFKDLTPDSPINELRAFAQQERLTIKTGGRTKEAIYMEIYDTLRRRGDKPL